MTHVTPFIVQAGRAVQGSSLGYHAYSLRVDNLSNQWYQEESTLVWIPPYSLGVIVRLWGTSVALLLPAAPIGQPQLAPITGEYAVAIFSDEYRTENPGVPVRQFTLVQAVSDLTQGPQPALPPVGVDRIYADTSGNIHHLHSDGTDRTLVDPSNAGTLLYPTFDPHYQALVNATALGGDLYGTVSAAHIAVANGGYVYLKNTSAAPVRSFGMLTDNNNYLFVGSGGQLIVYSDYFNGGAYLTVDANANLITLAHPTQVNATLGVTGQATFSGPVYCTGSVIYIPSGACYITNASNNMYLRATGVIIQDTGGGVTAQLTSGQINANGVVSSTVGFSAANTGWILTYAQSSSYGLYVDGSNWIWSHAGGRWTHRYAGVTDSNMYIRQMTNGSYYFQLDGMMTTAGLGLVVAGNNLQGQAFYVNGGAGGAGGWQVISDRKLKSNITPITDALSIALDPRVNSYHFDVTPPAVYDLETKEITYQPSSYQAYGYISDDWVDVAPDVISESDDKGLKLMDYGQVAAILFSAFREYVAKTDARLNALETPVVVP